MTNSAKAELDRKAQQLEEGERILAQERKKMEDNTNAMRAEKDRLEKQLLDLQRSNEKREQAEKEAQAAEAAAAKRRTGSTPPSHRRSFHTNLSSVESDDNANANNRRKEDKRQHTTHKTQHATHT